MMSALSLSPHPSFLHLLFLTSFFPISAFLNASSHLSLSLSGHPSLPCARVSSSVLHLSLFMSLVRLLCVCVKDCSGLLWERNEEQREEMVKLSWLTPLGGQEAYTDILHLAQVHTIWVHSPVNWGFSSCWSRLNRAKFGAPGCAGSPFLWVQQQSAETGLVSGPA